jgi:hypothetical protein
VTREDAVARCEQLNRDEAGDRRWFAKQLDGGDWDVVAIRGTGFGPRGPLKEVTQAKPSPSDAPDPRPSIFRNVPPYGAG